MRITDVKVTLYAQPMSPLHVGKFGGAPQEISLVTVTTDEGIVGYGSARAQGGTGARVIAEAILKTVRPRLLGEDPLDRERLWQRLWALDRGGYLPIFATSAVDVALWDIAGKAAGLPLWKLLGGARPSLPAYASSAFHPRAEAYADEAIRYREHGYTAYKLHPPGTFGQDLTAYTAVRRAVGDDYVLMADPAGTYDHREALRMAASWKPWTSSGMRSRCQTTIWPAMPSSAAPSTSRSSAARLWPAAFALPPSTSASGPSTSYVATSTGRAASPACSRWRTWPRPTG